MKHSLCSAVAVFILPVSFGFSATQDAAPVDVRTVLTTLQTIKKKQADGSKSDKIALAQQYLALARDTASATAYYEDAIRATKFEGQSRESTQFQEWKKAESDRMHSKPFRDGLSIHFLYLSLTMRRSAGVEVKDLLPDLISYTQQVMSAQDSGDGSSHSALYAPSGNFNRPGKKGPSAQTLLNPRQGPPPLEDEWVKSSVSSSIFVVWKQVQDYVSGIENWEMVPGNINGIYQKTILPEFRRVKDPRVLEYWDMRIQRDEDAASRSGRSFDYNKFSTIAKPQLMWSRAQELLVLDLKNRAINDMMVIIKSYPTHPDIPDWISQVEALVQPPAAAPAPAAPAANAPPAATGAVASPQG